MDARPGPLKGQKRLIPPIRPAGDMPPPNRASRSQTCASCAVNGACLFSTHLADDAAAVEALTRVRRRLRRKRPVYRCGEAFHAIYAVRSGSFKTVALGRSGSEKVVGLHLPGEVMGLEEIGAGSHGYEATALEDSEVCVVPFPALSALAQRSPDLQLRLLRTLSNEIARDSGLLLLLGSMDARQRIVSFLLNLSRRYERLGFSPRQFQVRLSRQEIGSYLGLTLETVSRTISKLQREGMLHARQKDIVLDEPAKLAVMAEAW